MKIDVTEVLNRPGKSVKFECLKTIEVITVAEYDFLFESPISVSGKLMYTGEDYIVKGLVAVKYKSNCNRCSKEISNNLKFEFSEEYSKVEDEDYPDRYLFENNEIDLEKMILNNISLIMPMKHLCDEDCKGLCPICGGNLNNTDCDCIEEEKQKSSPFAKIRELSFEDKDLGGVGNGSTKEKNV